MAMGCHQVATSPASLPHIALRLLYHRVLSLLGHLLGRLHAVRQRNLCGLPFFHRQRHDAGGLEHRQSLDPEYFPTSPALAPDHAWLHGRCPFTEAGICTKYVWDGVDSTDFPNPAHPLHIFDMTTIKIDLVPSWTGRLECVLN